MDRDGGGDDYLATMLLMTMDHLQPLGVVVTPADCYIQPALGATHKILDLMGCSYVPVAESTVRGINVSGGEHLHRIGRWDSGNRR